MTPRHLFPTLTALLLAVLAGPLAAADVGRPADAAPSPPVLAGAACPAPAPAPALLAQTSPSDCCKGHKGVCGCRAGKIVCCDNTVSPNCTCHGAGEFVH